MNIHHLETFIYVVRLKSIHKAAETLFLSQPTVSARIKSLERELNTELFARQGRGLLLTEDGRKFIFYAERIMEVFEEGKKRMERSRERKEIVIGANPITSQYFIPFALPLWKQLNPQLHFKLISASNEVLYEKLVQRKVDFAFMKDVENSGVEKHQLVDNSIRLIVYPEHFLQYEQTISINELAAEPLVLYEGESSDRNSVRKLFELEKNEPKIEFQVNHLEVAKSIIKNRDAIGFLPYMSVKRELENGQLIGIDVENLMQKEQRIHLTYLNSDTAKWPFLESIKESVELFHSTYIVK